MNNTQYLTNVNGTVGIFQNIKYELKYVNYNIELNQISLVINFNYENKNYTDNVCVIYNTPERLKYCICLAEWYLEDFLEQEKIKRIWKERGKN